MPYQVSSNRKRLELQLDDIIRNLRVADKKGVPTALRNYAIAAAIFLAHAEVENYFVDSLAGIAAIYSNNITSASSLPVRLRAHLVVERLNFEAIATKFFMKSGEPDLLSAVEKMIASPLFSLLSGASPLPGFLGDHIHGDQSYPSEKNIERVLRRIGVGNPKGELNRAAKRDAMSLLESVANLRTALAHSASLPGVSCADVIQRLDGLKIFARAMDRLFYSHIRASLPHAAWRGGMC